MNRNLFLWPTTVRTLLRSMLFALAILGAHRTTAAATSSAAGTQSASACAPCHRDLVERYSHTPMANASGPAERGLIPADFTHAVSGVHYRVLDENGAIWLTYDRNDPARSLHGRQQLLYFLGSGKRGRTYLFQQEGHWFEAPINWYAKKHLWDMAPAYQNDREMPLTLPVDPGCLHCHFSGAASSLPDARNHYAALPFASGGITCEACHGDSSAHIASGGKTKMLDIDALAPVRRDSICLNCHLEGQVGVNKRDKHPEDFRPGDNLFDYAVFYVHQAEQGSGGRATSQWEALLKSQCRIRSGDKLTCTTCHDPHGSPAPDQRVAFYRAKCLTCHTGATFATQHHPEQPDCTQCHMARNTSTDIAHEQVTDHWIRRRVSDGPTRPATTGPLVPVGSEEDTPRALGLAYAQLAAQGNHDAAQRALELLHGVASSEPAAAQDAELHAELGFLEELSGDTTAAAANYRAALMANPDENLAAGNLALVDASRHDYSGAAKLWALVLQHDPAQSAAGTNLAVVLCGAGQRERAQSALERVLQFAPDNDRARTMLSEIRQGTQPCSARK